MNCNYWYEWEKEVEGNRIVWYELRCYCHEITNDVIRQRTGRTKVEAC